MGKTIIDQDYEKVKKQYAELLAQVNPKPTGEELEELRKRIEARRWGKGE